jgi:DNA-binding FadR family transcriptional regulator
LASPARNNGRPQTEQRRLKKSETVAHQIVSDIHARGLKQGDVLPSENAMLTEYSVSRQSLREALRLIEVQGLITLKPGPGGGPSVGTVDPENLARTASMYFNLGGMTYGQLFDAQMEMEPTCAQLAARNGDPEALREAFGKFIDMEHPLEGPEYFKRVHEFHVAVYEMSGSPIYALLTRTMSHIITSHVMATMDLVDRRADVVEEHRRLAGAIIRGETERVYRMMAEHYEGINRFYREHWPARFKETIEWR